MVRDDRTWFAYGFDDGANDKRDRSEYVLRYYTRGDAELYGRGYRKGQEAFALSEKRRELRNELKSGGSC